MLTVSIVKFFYFFLYFEKRSWICELYRMGWEATIDHWPLSMSSGIITTSCTVSSSRLLPVLYPLITTTNHQALPIGIYLHLSRSRDSILLYYHSVSSCGLNDCDHYLFSIRTYYIPVFLVRSLKVVTCYQRSIQIAYWLEIIFCCDFVLLANSSTANWQLLNILN